jgi:hypothetical protein
MRPCLTCLLACLAGLLSSVATRGADFPPLFPFLISYDGPDNASSMAHLLDAPAGRHGFVRVEQGRFVNDAGPVRLHATNLTGPANFPSHKDADRLAARLARFGINCVRLHYMDGEYGNFMTPKEPCITGRNPATQRQLDPGQMDRLDYMIAAFKRRGIYVDINLHVARHWDERDGFSGTTQRPGFDRGLDSFEPRMIELEQEYARKLLTHVNPYTRRAYADDPCVAMVELNNENALLQVYQSGLLDQLPEPYAGVFRRQWNAWLAQKYASTAALRAAWQWKSTPLGNEQIPEGKFDAPLTIDGRRWVLALGGAQATCQARGGVLQLVVTRPGAELFPKLFRSLSVRKDQVYTLSFKIRCRNKGEGPALGMAVADAQGGWRSLGVHQTLNVGQAWKTVRYVFAAADDSPHAQFQLTRFPVGSYEIDDLSFQSGAQSAFNGELRLEDHAVPTLKTGAYAPPLAVADFYRFLIDTERKYWLGLFHFLKHELKVKSLISGTQLGYSPPQVQAELDYVDIHAYWRHPSRVGPQWEIMNDPLVNAPGGTIQQAGNCRVLGKPYTISEYNHPFPNQYGAEGQPLVRAYGRLQGWDGVFEYTYNHQPNFQPDHNTYFFSMIARTDVLAHLPACAAMYLRGDVREARSTVVAPIDCSAYFERLSRNKTIGAGIASAGFDPRLTLLHKTAVDLSGKLGTPPDRVPKIAPDQKVFVSDTGELTWNVEQPGAGYWTVHTPNTKLFTGFPQGRTIRLGQVTLAVGRTRLDWATVSLVSRQATGFGESGRPANILVAATGQAENKGMVIQRQSERSIKLTDWGQGPVYVEGIPLTLTLPAAAERVRCFALDPHGDRKRAVPVEKAADGTQIVLRPEYETVWYELDIR